MPSGLIDQIMEDLVRSIGSSLKASLSKTTASGGGIGGNGGGNTVGNLPALPSLQGTTTPAYEPKPYPGPTIGQQATGAVAGGVAAKAAAAAVATLPDIQRATTMQLAASQSRTMGVAPSYHDVELLQQSMTRAGTATSVPDAAIALQKAGLMGFSGKSINAYQQSLVSASNVMPGMGLSGAADVYASMQAAKNVNMSKLMGIEMRDQAGRPKSLDDIVEQLWAQLNKRKSVSRKITADDISFALMPGNSLDWTLRQYFAGNEDLRQTVIQMLYAKAKGAKNFSQQEMRRVGMTTDVITSQSAKTAEQLEVAQGTEGAMLSGFEHATDAMGKLTDAISGLTSVMGPFVAIQGAKGAFDRAHGGPVQTSKPFIIGEHGPEVFVPKSDGMIIPNESLPEHMRLGTAGKLPETFAYAAKGANLGKKVTGAALLRLLYKTGFRGEQLRTAYGVAIAESGGDSTRWTNEGNDDSWGLFQINFAEGANKVGTFKQKSVGKRFSFDSKDDWTDPALNAYTAYYMTGQAHGKHNWSNWTTYTSGAYKNHMPSAKMWTNFLKNNPQAGGGKAPTSSVVANASNGVSKSPSSSDAGGNWLDELLGGAADYFGSLFGDRRGSLADISSYRSSLTPGKIHGDLPIAGLAGTRAKGGPVRAGQKYLVGENGPEAYVTSSSSGVNYGGVKVYITVPESHDEEKMVRSLIKALGPAEIERNARIK